MLKEIMKWFFCFLLVLSHLVFMSPAFESCLTIPAKPRQMKFGPDLPLPKAAHLCEGNQTSWSVSLRWARGRVSEQTPGANRAEENLD